MLHNYNLISSYVTHQERYYKDSGADSFDQNRLKELRAHAGTHPTFLHSPNTTSAFTYRVYGNNYYSGSGTTTLNCHTANRTNAFSTMTLMEISGT